MCEFLRWCIFISPSSLYVSVYLSPFHSSFKFPSAFISVSLCFLRLYLSPHSLSIIVSLPLSLYIKRGSGYWKFPGKKIRKKLKLKKLIVCKHIKDGFSSLSFSLSVSVCISPTSLSFYVSVFFSLPLSVSVFLYHSLFLCFCLSLYVSVCLYLSLFLSLSLPVSI